MGQQTITNGSANWVLIKKFTTYSRFKWVSKPLPMAAATSHRCRLCHHHCPLYFHRRPYRHHHKSPPVHFHHCSGVL
ncbi:hypothetical protein HanRHA438_Chr09g0402791 [Helianthus annuus]|nr:hypothetical protein HanRHA438_Chr09g0402791 [Helianthus annuus]